MFVFDTSGSMQPVLNEAKLEIEHVVGRLRETLPNPAFGVAEVRDYGGSLYDSESSDEPWQLDSSITTDSTAISSAIGNLQAAGGGDGPEAYGRAIWETDTNPDVHWRSGARHLIVLIADNVPHAPNLNEGIAEAFWLSPSPWDTGEELPGSWLISDTTLGGGQLEFHGVLRQVAADGKPLEMVDYHQTGGADYIHYWEAWAGLGGGQALEALEGSGELADKLVGVVEKAPEDTVCATAFGASPATSPPGVAPAALTPRFHAPGSRLVLTPSSGKVFCPGQYPKLGGDVVTALEEDSGSQIAFRVPGAGSAGLSVTNLSGGENGFMGYGIDNFRYPWGFSEPNHPMQNGTGYDGSLTPTAQDLNAVFSGLGPPGSPEYNEALGHAKWALGHGLCYGFALLSRALYADARGGHVPLGYTASSGLGLSPGSLPYPLRESSTGSHALTHALMRAAISQFAPSAQRASVRVYSSSTLAKELDSAFAAGLPSLVDIFFPGGGHTLLAYDYQSPDPTTGEGLVMEVVDPNIPWSVARPPGDYGSLQVHVRANGSWSYSFSSPVAAFSSGVSGGPGSLYAVPHPADAGGLPLHDVLAGDPAPIALSASSGAIAGISYGSQPSNTTPSDVSLAPIAVDSPQDTALVPASHRRVTVTLSGGSSGLEVDGSRFLDSVHLQGAKNTVAIEPRSGSITIPATGAGTTLSVTSIVGGVQRSATATISGKLYGVQVSISPSGTVTVSSARGSGSVSLATATYTAEGTQVRTSRETHRFHGRTRLRRHTPKPKRRKHKHKPVHHR